MSLYIQNLSFVDQAVSEIWASKVGSWCKQHTYGSGLEVEIYSYRLYLFVYKIWGFYLYPFSSYGILNFPYMPIAIDTH